MLITTLVPSQLSAQDPYLRILAKTKANPLTRKLKASYSGVVKVQNGSGLDKGHHLRLYLLGDLDTAKLTRMRHSHFQLDTDVGLCPAC
jgi:hypothetical protein